MKFQLGFEEKIGVCRQAFRLAYRISRDYLNTICQDVRLSRLNSEGQFSDRQNPLLSGDFQKYCQTMDAALGLQPTAEQRAAGRISNSPEAHECWAWMKYYFDLVGDFQPNTDGEIHLEPCTVKDVWTAYVHDQQNAKKLNFLSYDQFGKLWLTLFE